MNYPTFSELTKKAGATTGRENSQGSSLVLGMSHTARLASKKVKVDPLVKINTHLSDGFALCLSAWYEKNFHRIISKDLILKFWSSSGLLAKLIRLESPVLIKWFKFQLCWNFSNVTGQEKPEGSFEPIKIQNLFPKGFGDFIEKLAFRRSRLLRAYWDLLQCKTLSYTVPRTMINEAYKKHHLTMSKQSSVLSESTRQSLYEFSLEWAKIVRSVYTEKSKLPKDHASFELKRSEGGTKAALSGRIVRHGVRRVPVRERRLDPVVIHIQGLPKIGKSHMLDEICKKILAAFDLPIKDLSSNVYCRSGATKHWDGYLGQFITIIDDYGHIAPTSQNRSAEDPTSELITLCSNVDYILPMANIKDKGMKFKSEFLIITSNRATDIDMSIGLSCPAAYYRRLSPTYMMNPDRTFSIKEYKLPYEMSLGYESYGWVTNTQLVSKDTILKNALYEWDRRSKGDNRSWYQPISNSNPGFALEFPEKPPKGLSMAMTYAIPEPLKVRMITKPEAQTYALKPLQLAMFEALKSFKCFEPCHNPVLDLSLFESNIHSDKFFLSGDYTAATDELSFDASQTVLQSLIDVFQDHPFIPGYLKWEGSTHLIKYPEYLGLPDVVQKNGQLMGSLLSFPILSIINAYTMCTATRTTMETVPARFHGDDIAAVCTEAEFSLWKQEASNVGLSLSIGKNYLSKEFFSIDSQLYIIHGDHIDKATTGKYKLACDAKDMQSFHKALSQRFRKDQIVRFNKKTLMETPQSLDISSEYGGLGIENSSEFSFKDKAIYYFFKKKASRVKCIADDTYIVPKSLKHLLQLDSSQIYVDELETENRTLKELNRFLYRLRKDKVLSEKIEKLDPLKQGPIMNSHEIIHCVDYTCEELQKLADSQYHVHNYSLRRNVLTSRIAPTTASSRVPIVVQNRNEQYMVDRCNFEGKPLHKILINPGVIKSHNDLEKHTDGYWVSSGNSQPKVSTYVYNGLNPFKRAFGSSKKFMTVSHPSQLPNNGKRYLFSHH